MCVEAHLACELAARAALRLHLSSFCPVVNLAVALIAHVTLSPRTQPQNCICSVADGDKCEDMIAADGVGSGGGERCLITETQGWVTDAAGRSAAITTNTQMRCFIYELATTPGQIYFICASEQGFFLLFLWFEGYAAGYDASTAWRRLEIKTGERRGDSRRKKSRKDNKGDGVSWQCPLRKSPPSALIQLYSTTYACFAACK